jgi:hypothetical protein
MLAIVSMVCAAAAAAQAPAVTVASLDWLEGHWRSEREPGEITEEVWIGARAGKMFGIGRSVQGRLTRSFEYMRIEEGEGGLTFVAQPGGAPPTRFVMVSHARNEVVFENRATDYPQRVVYRRQGDRLTATISLADGSKAVSWSFRRVRAR